VAFFPLGSIDYGARRGAQGNLTSRSSRNEDFSAESSASLRRSGNNVSWSEIKTKFLTSCTARSRQEGRVEAARAPEPRVWSAGPSAVPGKTKGARPVHSRPDGEADARGWPSTPCSGRDFEIRHGGGQSSRAAPNNPILTGEAGVGKTAVVEGLSVRIAQKDGRAAEETCRENAEPRPPSRPARDQGGFENRLEVRPRGGHVLASDHLVIDEAHRIGGRGERGGPGW